jgi:hypothetical protein
MATTNLLQWNPTAANQETDAQYLADSQRLAGAVNPELFNDVLANKLFFQLTTYLAAQYTAFASKGFNTSDASFATLTAQCANWLTTADVKPALMQVSFASSLVFNCALANGFQVTLTGNASLTVSNASVNQPVLLVFTQDSVGGRTVTYPGNVLSAGTVNSTANSSSAQPFVVLADGNLHPIGPMVVS